MKRSIFAVFAALTLLLAAPVLAQEETTEQPPEDTRTQPDADNIAGESGLTITGTVVEWNDEQLTLRTATGIEHIQIVPDTDRPVEFTAGENVTVDYTRTSQGVMIAQEIRPQGAVTGDETDVATTDLTTDADVEAQADLETDVDAMDTEETELETTADTDFDTTAETELDTTADTRLDDEFDTDTDLDTQADLDADAELDTTLDDDTLPATGSELPLLALLGLLSVAAAIGVRSLIR